MDNLARKTITRKDWIEQNECEPNNIKDKADELISMIEYNFFRDTPLAKKMTRICNEIKNDKNLIQLRNELKQFKKGKK